MKKALIIYPMERGLEDTEKLKYEQFARKNDIEIIGEIQFPYFESLKDYKRLLNILKTNGCHELLCNDEFWLFANVYSDGQFLKDLKASDLRLYDRDHRCQVDKIWEMIDKEMTVPLKQAINHALKDVEKEFDEGIQKDRTGVIVVQRQDVNMGNTLSRQFQEKGFSRIIVVAIDHMDQEVANEVENLFKNNDIEKVLLYDSRSLDESIKNVFDELSFKYDVPVERFSEQSQEQRWEALTMNMLN